MLGLSRVRRAVRRMGSTKAIHTIVDGQSVLAITLLVLLAGVATVAFAPSASAVPGPVGVSQNGTCHQVTPLGDGTQNVSEFYDYRHGSGTAYSSYGTTHLQQSQTSQLFVYEGSEGLSLVFLHDEYGDEQYGGTTTFEITGLPSAGEWAVKDDDYGSDTDDDWETNASPVHIDWKWGPSRNDGGAYRGLGTDYDEITIDPAFNEEADHYGDWAWSTDENRTHDWILRTSPDDAVSLSMTDPVTIRPSCTENAPNASLSAPSDAEVGTNVTLDAGGSTDDNGIMEYRWDVDGDGSIDTTTETATYDHSYEMTGTYTPTVTVVDELNQTDTANTSVTVSDTTPPSVTIDGPTSAMKDETITLSGANSTDNGNISSYEWEFGDGSTATGVTVDHAYSENGTYTVTLTVTDEAGNNATETHEVIVDEPDTTDPVARLDAPAEAELGDPVTLDASNSSDDRGVAQYRWDVGADGSVEETTTSPTYETTFDQRGDQPVRVTVADDAGNENATTATVTVRDTTSPTVNLDAPASATTNESVTFSGVNSTDNGNIASYEWEFGDEATTTGATVDHAYAENGTYTVALTVTDEAGNNATETATVNVTTADDSPPEVNIDGPTKATKGETVEFSAIASDDGQITAYEWDFGDGTTTSGEHVSHTYDKTGTFSVELTVTDDNGNSATETMSVEVSPKDSQPTVDIEGPTSVKAGEKAQYTATATDDGTIKSYEWNLGDGTTKSGEKIWHTYEKPGNYTVEVTVTDDDGNVQTDTHIVCVKKNDDSSSDDGSKDDGSKDGSNNDGAKDGSKDESNDDGSKDGNDNSNTPSGGSSSPPADSGDSSSPPANTGGSDDSASSQPSPETDVKTPMSGVAELQASNLAADDALAVDLPAEMATADVAFEQVRIDHDGIEQLNLRLRTGTPAQGVDDVWSTPAVLLAQSDSGLDQTGAMTVTFSMPAEAFDGHSNPSDVALYAGENGNWTRLDTAVTETDDDRVRFQATAPHVMTLAVGMQAPTPSVVDVKFPDRAIAGDRTAVDVIYRNAVHTDVTLTPNVTVNGTRLSGEPITIPANTTTTVSIPLTLDRAGAQSLSVAGQTGQLRVEEPTAAFTVTEVTTDRTVAADRPTKIVATVRNDGTGAGNYTAKLELFGEVVDRKSVDVPAGETVTVTFTRQVSSPGSYTATVGNASSSFTVADDADGVSPTPTNGNGAGFGLIAALVAFTVAALVRRR